MMLLQISLYLHLFLFWMITSTSTAIHFGFLRRLIPPFLRRGKSSSTKLGHSTNGAVGLRNLANTCYMNSVLQSMFHCTSYREKVLESMFVENSIGEKITWLFQEMMTNDDGRYTADPRQVAQALNLNVGTQEDAQEFMLRLFHDIDDSLLPSDEEHNQQSGVIDNVTIPSHIFRGYTEQTIQCINVDFVKKRKQKFLDLTIDIVGFRTLKDALVNMFSQPDFLTGENQYRAIEPYGLQDAEKRLHLISLPQTLCVTLKRFQYENDSGTLKKICDPLEFPLTLDLSDCHSTPTATTATTTASSTLTSSSSYDLSSIVVHEGTANFGHYTCYARPQPRLQPDHWLLFNDHMVSQVSYQEVCKATFGSHGNRSAYLLFYQKHK